MMGGTLSACHPDAPGGVVRGFPAPDASDLEPRVVLTIPNPELQGVVSGAVSPDGRRFALTLAGRDDVQVWVAEMGDGTARRLTTRPAKRYDLAWAPDGRRLAYWEGDTDGLYTLDVRSGAETRVWRGRRVPFIGSANEFPSNPSWSTDGRLVFTRVSIDLGSRGADDLWYLRDGRPPARRLEIGMGAPSHLVFSPDGRSVAYFSGCCGGGGQALWVRDVRSRRETCVAGPLAPADVPPAWSPDGRELYFAAGATRGDTLAHAFAARADGTGSRRMDSGGAPVLSLSASRAGDVYLISGGRNEPRIRVVRHPAAAVAKAAGGGMAACPPPDPRIRRFVDAQHLPDLRGLRVVLDDRAHDVALFGVSFGEEQDWGLYHGAVGVRAGEQTGWVMFDGQGPDSTRRDWFDPDPAHPFLWSGEVREEMERMGLREQWLGILASDADTPAEWFTALADEAPLDTLWGYGLVAFALRSPAVRGDAARLLRLAAFMRRPGQRWMASPAGEALWAIAPRAARDPAAPEPLLVAVAEMLGEHRYQQNDTTRAVVEALEASPAARASAAVQAVLVGMAGRVSGVDPRGAAERLLERRAAPDSLLDIVARRFRTDSAMALRMLRSPAFASSPGAMAWLLAPDVRPDVRGEALRRVMADPHAAERALMAVANIVEQQDYALRSRLLAHPVARRSPRVLAMLLSRFARFAHLRSTAFDRDYATRVRALLVARLADPSLGERELEDVASQLRMTDNTAVMMRMLEHPAVRHCERILQVLSYLGDRTYSGGDAAKPTPRPEEVEARAKAVLAAPGPHTCRTAEVVDSYEP